MNSNNQKICDVLGKLQNFYFFPNRGNLGDVVIAASEYQFFDSQNYDYKILDPEDLPQTKFSLVYGGGGLWTKYYDYSNVLNVFNNKNADKIVILPSSFNECDDLLKIADERFVIFCREEKSYNYCLSKNSKAQFILSDDMALGLDIDFYKKREHNTIKKVHSREIKDIYTKLFIPYKKILKTIPDVFNKITKINNRSIGYFLRHDVEGHVDWSSSNINFNVDLSQILGSYCIDSAFSKIIAKAFLAMIDTVDIVVTDRLHVGICAHLLNKEVVLVDNTYGKISSVYNFSLKQYDNVRLVSGEEIDHTLQDISGRVPISRRDNFNAPGGFYSFLAEYLNNKKASCNKNYEKFLEINARYPNKIKRFIDCNIPVKTCNLRCHYCYITQVHDFDKELPVFPYSPEHMASALSVERLGGICNLNLCGDGETMLPPEIVPIARELLKQGHYVNIITNGTFSKRFDEMIELPKELLSRLFFKFSFQFLELKRLNLLDVFINNIKKVSNAGCSFTVEITPNDELIPYIDEIKEISLKNFGALPHITVARNNKQKDLPILTNLSKEEYKNVWGQFDSVMFNYKLDCFNVKRTEFCYAGLWTAYLMLGTGLLKQCYAGKIMEQNIFEDINKPITFSPVGKNCPEPHCFNSHAWLAFGDIPLHEAPTYADITNRACKDCEEWLKPNVKELFSTKLKELNNCPFVKSDFGY